MKALMQVMVLFSLVGVGYICKRLKIISNDMTYNMANRRGSLLKQLMNPCIVSVIIGLDYYHDDSPMDIQKKWFIEQIRLAKDLKLPIIIHDRESNDDVLEEALKNYIAKL